jgi:hypothetical protein
LATDDENNPLSGVPVTLKLLPSGTLLGTVTETTDSSGVATFGSLAVDTTGYYQLEASTSASQFNTTTSTVFFIADTAQPCSGITSCSESLADQTGNASATVVNAGDDILSLGLGGLPYNCPGYTTVSGAIATDVWHGNIIDNAISAQTTLVINKTTVEQRGPDDGASSFQVCYAEQKASASQAPFTTLSGAPASTTMLPVGSQTLTFYVGLLPDCRSKSPQAPCLLSRHKDNAGDVILTFLGTGDYFGSG